MFVDRFDAGERRPEAAAMPGTAAGVLLTVVGLLSDS
jgi:hypothetical protein